MLVRDVHIPDMLNCIEHGTITIGGEIRTPKNNSINSMKTLYNLLFDYAVSIEIVDKNYARLFNVESGYVRSPTCHMAYTSEELDLLWANVDKHPIIDMILIQCYSGWRPGEMCELLMKDIDLERGCMMGGLKTKAGINRTVPIHPRIFHLVKARYEKALAANSPYLFFSIRMKSNGPTRPKGELMQMRYSAFKSSSSKKLFLFCLSILHIRDMTAARLLLQWRRPLALMTLLSSASSATTSKT